MAYHVEAYYLAGQKSPEILSSPEDIDTLVDQLLSLTFLNSIAAVYLVERPRLESGAVDHEFSLAVDRDHKTGALKFMDATGNWVTRGPEEDRSEIRFYYIQGNETEFAPDSGIPLSLVRQAGKEFLASGGQRPTCVQWQKDTYV
jgi:hypothetical protein